MIIVVWSSFGTPLHAVDLRKKPSAEQLSSHLDSLDLRKLGETILALGRVTSSGRVHKISMKIPLKQIGQNQADPANVIILVPVEVLCVRGVLCTVGQITVKETDLLVERQSIFANPRVPLLLALVSMLEPAATAPPEPAGGTSTLNPLAAASAAQVGGNLPGEGKTTPTNSVNQTIAASLTPAAPRKEIPHAALSPKAGEEGGTTSKPLGSMLQWLTQQSPIEVEAAVSRRLATPAWRDSTALLQKQLEDDLRREKEKEQMGGKEVLQRDVSDKYSLAAVLERSALLSLTHAATSMPQQAVDAFSAPENILKRIVESTLLVWFAFEDVLLPNVCVNVHEDGPNSVRFNKPFAPGEVLRRSHHGTWVKRLGTLLRGAAPRNAMTTLDDNFSEPDDDQPRPMCSLRFAPIATGPLISLTVDQFELLELTCPLSRRGLSLVFSPPTTTTQDGGQVDSLGAIGLSPRTVFALRMWNKIAEMCSTAI